MPITNYPFVSPVPTSMPKPSLPLKIVNPHNKQSLLTWGLIDTGADVSAIPEFIADQLCHDLSKGKKQTNRAAGGKIDIYLHTFEFDILQFDRTGHIGDTIIRTPKRRIAVVPGLTMVLLGERDFLSRYILTIDYPHKTFSLNKPKRKTKKK